ncbi:hypothetical protein ALQ60_101417 [Pseudomonas syringae pv. papulans]|nr:hypothetical protein ALO65_101528 [Pseudomonas syringae pv. papulans]RMM28341.1 hypothetical protein ALQ81_101668 [Pseudomonas syringae pv. pisi]RMU59729.1 hypothetical protein ALP25_101595 [Pseudomonas syringae pv. syringae]RMN37603.1 hypothetical protein ALQ60_101417 [Pseudomonas syringae pv. papulans]RMN70246.1 hypothetical protein ALQ56_101993 [Pseudomonas syringae pv. papulans]
MYIWPIDEHKQPQHLEAGCGGDVGCFGEIDSWLILACFDASLKSRC